MARHRTFLAIDVGDAIRKRLVSLQETMGQAAPGVKWVEPQNLHLTLHFLGEINERDVLPVCRGVGETCAALPFFSMEVKGVGCFPTPRRPRTVWVGLGEGVDEVKALHAALEEKLLALGCYRREERAYTPHITLGRVKQDEAADLSDLLRKHAAWQAGAIPVREVLVLSSELTPQGPIYTPLGRGKLATARGTG